MVSISPDELALELLNQCLRGSQHSPELLQTLVRLALSPDAEQARRASHALFGIVVERLADLFEPCLCDSYAALFSEVIEQALPDLEAGRLLERHRRIRERRKFAGGKVREVYVLSRITLGADVAITSLCLDAMKKRFPEAAIYLVGPRKNFELFEGDLRIRHAAVAYGREGTLAARLSIFPSLTELLCRDGAIVVDPDSRLTQLGLLPVCPEEDYYFFESRCFGGYGDEALPELTRHWLEETFDVEGVAAYVAPASSSPRAEITVSLGVGENPAKRVSDAFERALLEEVTGRGRTVLVDHGWTAEEAARVDRAIAGLPNVSTWTGAFAPFAAAIAGSRLYCGYDSAGQHVAAACGVPLLCVFTGFASPRMFQRWQPSGRGPKKVIRMETPDTAQAVEAARQAVETLLGGE